jgi:hypothetical protein
VGTPPTRNLRVKNRRWIVVLEVVGQCAQLSVHPSGLCGWEQEKQRREY